jgi:hypothetical protein
MINLLHDNQVLQRAVTHRNREKNTSWRLSMQKMNNFWSKNYVKGPAGVTPAQRLPIRSKNLEKTCESDALTLCATQHSHFALKSSKMRTAINIMFQNKTKVAHFYVSGKAKSICLQGKCFGGPWAFGEWCIPFNAEFHGESDCEFKKRLKARLCG